MLLFILYNVLPGSDKNIVICQQYTYSPEPHMGSLFNASIIFNLVKCYYTYYLLRLWLVHVDYLMNSTCMGIHPYIFKILVKVKMLHS